ncbi:MAG: DUF3352 domain-containing protein [Cyanobium sp.]
MKARPFLASLLALLLLLLGLAGLAWWQVWERSPLQLQHRALVLPRAARFVSRDAPIALHLLSDGREPVGYARAVAPSRERRQAVDAIERLRDGAFAAAGLDYSNELAGWLAPEISVALFDRPGASQAGPSRTAPEPGGNWLLALRSRDAGGARRFLQRFWQTRSLAGTDLQVSSYRGMGLISGRGALVGQQPVPLATALIDDDLLLIASGRGVLEEALDVSQIDELNQAADPSLQAGLARLGRRAALLVARGAAAVPLGLPAAAPDAPTSARLLASLRPEDTSLRLTVLIDHPAAQDVVAVRLAEEQRRRLLALAPARPAALSLLQDPALLRQDPLLRGLVDLAAPRGAAAGPLPSLVLARADGPLLSVRIDDDWLLATPSGQPATADLEAPLAAAGLIPAPLETAGSGSVTVWTRLEAATARGSRAAREGLDGRDRLLAPVEGWQGEQDGLALWGRSLALLDRDPESRGARPRQRQLQQLDRPGAPIQWALDADQARGLLASWGPWRRLAGLAGGPIDGSVRGLALAVEPTAEELVLQARLDLGGSR